MEKKKALKNEGDLSPYRLVIFLKLQLNFPGDKTCPFGSASYQLSCH